MKKNIFITAFIVTIALICVLAITKPWNNQPIYGLCSGTYEMKNAKNAAIPPVITFDVEAFTFSFQFDPLSSYLAVGTWTLDSNKIVAKTDDNQYVYIFQVRSNDTLRFVEKGSSKIPYIDKTLTKNPPIVNGTEFVLQE